MQDADYFDAFSVDPVNQDVVGVDHDFSCAGYSSMTVKVGMLGQRQHGRLHAFLEAPCCLGILVGYIGENGREVITGTPAPDDR
ncbi:hypothetical protein A9972_13240 [Pseudomonas sp. UME83]|uniref:Uncharacterized protein n=1 Tax=Pseudomonas citronellolis TaxID=53408 RepID=A0A1A9K787_9PSED|nr:hypothetical protein A9C11_05090 [Pseudomonas citronellolis]KSW26196.1 hypothetical protein AOX63_21405 [Pseudomonas sp. ADP]MBB1605953.1 hypothetical protein [Pseudomonas sp. UMC76]MBB1639000.1 hypothetical protein [Pseudomonas sp. UME83]OBP10910.1 hypothetical protein BAE52_11520 [Pseudomonas sp. EGD-AKN5]OHR78596.1 hypothetical protein HMPREF3289_02780 [Pseudomonas sp. HMSC75E02]